MIKMTFQELTKEMMHLYTNGKYADALHLVEQTSGLFPGQSARTTFWKLCLLSLCGRADDVISVFKNGLDSGLWWAEKQFLDSDLDAVRELSNFKTLVQESNKKCIEAQAHINHDRTVLVPDNVMGELPFLIALHGRNGDKDYNLEYWGVARQHGWLVLSPQSRQAIYPGSYCWDDKEIGLSDVLFHVEEIIKIYKVDSKRIVIGGFSQGSGMAIYAALSRKVNVSGFIGIGTSIAEPEALRSLPDRMESLRGYFVVGGKDYSLEKARAIQEILKEKNITFTEELHPELGHEFPLDFDKTFDKAVDFIFKETI